MRTCCRRLSGRGSCASLTDTSVAAWSQCCQRMLRGWAVVRCQNARCAFKSRRRDADPHRELDLLRRQGRCRPELIRCGLRTPAGASSGECSCLQCAAFCLLAVTLHGVSPYTPATQLQPTEIKVWQSCLRTTFCTVASRSHLLARCRRRHRCSPVRLQRRAAVGGQLLRRPHDELSQAARQPRSFRHSTSCLDHATVAGIAESGAQSVIIKGPEIFPQAHNAQSSS